MSKPKWTPYSLLLWIGLDLGLGLLWSMPAAADPDTAPTPRPAPAKPAVKTKKKTKTTASAPKPVAAKPAQDTEVSSLSLLSFQLQGLYAMQSGGAEIMTMQPSWTPSLWLSDSLTLRADLGGTLFRSATTQSLFAELGADLLISYSPLSFLALEAGGGVQYWISNGGLAPEACGKLVWLPHRKLLGLIDRVFAGYTQVLATVGTQEIKAGVGLAL